MPYLTPEELPEERDCRALFIPASSEWLAIVSGALTELLKTWNWEQQGSVTVDEAIAAMQEMIDLYYAGNCGDCELPEGGAIIRLRPDGTLEELIGGEWVEPEGDYVIPPPEEREGGSADDQICLAAKNAVNVYKELYESLSDSWNNDLDEAEAVAALIGVFVGIVGFAIAPITYGIYAFFAPIFAALFTALEYLIADLWDDVFEQTMTCFLVNCATNTAGVVTFDWQCFIDQLNARTNPFDLTEEQIRLYLQVIYLLYFTGGVDGLNLAGGTTAITDDDCTFCQECTDMLCEFIGDLCDDFYIATSDPAGFYLFPVYPGTTGTYVSTGGAFTGQGYVQSVNYPSTGQERSCVLVVLPDECSTVNSFSVYRYLNSAVANYNYIEMFDSSFAFIADQTVTGAASGWNILGWTNGVQTGVKYIMVMLDSQDGSVNGIGQIDIGLAT